MNSRSSPKIKQLQNSAGLILAEKKKAPSTLKDERSGGVFFCAHTGNSMHPTLDDGDLLEIGTFDRQSLRRGDVIFFMPPQGTQPAVHRVARVCSEGIRTRGDNSTLTDPWVLRDDDVIGKVIWAIGGKKRRPIYGGTAGSLWSFGVRGFRMVARRLSFFYHLLARSGLLRRLVPIHKRMRIVALHRKGRRAFKLLLGDWVIGNYQSGMNYWQIRRPFRLFVDVKSLPK